MLLELHDIAVSFAPGGSGHRLLERVNLSVDQGEFIVVRGVSGSGKSTLLRMICRLQPPSSGTIRFRGKPVDAFPPSVLRSRIGYVAQIPAIVDGSVIDNLLLPFSFAANRGKPEPSERELTEMLDRFYLSGVSPDQAARTLSVGQKQRLALMRTILQGPELLLLDEPTSSLDRESAAMVFAIIERLNSVEGRSIIAVTHSDYTPQVQHLRSFEVRNNTLVSL